MSAINDALKGIKDLLLLQNQVHNLERAAQSQVEELKRVGLDVIALDKRVVRIETMIEMSGRGTAGRRIEE